MAVSAAYGNVEVRGHLTMVKGALLRLTKSQQRMMEVLAAATGELVPTDAIRVAVYGPGYLPLKSNSLQVVASRLRSSLTEAGADVTVVSVRERGYMLERC
jgi:DNA-binding response OmpR family regulator